MSGFKQFQSMRSLQHLNPSTINPPQRELYPRMQKSDFLCCTVMKGGGMFPQAKFPAGQVSPDAVTTAEKARNAVFKVKHKPTCKSHYSLPYISIIYILNVCYHNNKTP